MILLIDNYDSFTYNLYQYFLILGSKVKVVRNDNITISNIINMNPELIILSPGPCTPNESGICRDILIHLRREYPILGICLGHQTIAKIFGAEIIKANEPMHGKISKIYHKNIGVFKNLKNPLNVTRYHSLIIDKKTIPKEFRITALSSTDEIMGIKHKKYLIEGVQFHPEAILTEMGFDLLNNFLVEVRLKRESLK